MTEKEYIDREAAKIAFQNMDAGSRVPSTLLTPEEFAEYLDDIPTADVVEVVRCKDCKYYQNSPNGLCYLHTEPCDNAKGYKGEAVCVEDNSFCSYGERKDNNGKK